METLETLITPKNADFKCKKCNFICFKNSDWLRHINTKKHSNGVDGTQMETFLTPKNAKKTCNCGKVYYSKSGLWKHREKCIENEENNTEETYNSNSILFELVKQNQEFQKLIVEQNKQIMELSNKSIVNNNYNNNNVNSNNKTFNLNMFLNEKCKDALNITDFVNSLNLSLTDLENVGEYGFVDGISKIFVNGLKSLDIYKRPIHCSDLKRETMHVKEENGWEKDNEKKDKLRKVVKMIAHKNMLKVSDWKKAYPQYKDSLSKKNDQYLKILISSSGSHNKEDEENDYNKIIRNVAKEVTIDKAI